MVRDWGAVAGACGRDVYVLSLHVYTQIGATFPQSMR